jgi:CBS domain-containing protein
MNVGRHMQAGTVTVAPDAPLCQARDLMEEHGFGLLLVAATSGTLEGFITRAGLREIKD